jgi:Putative motility protein
MESVNSATVTNANSADLSTVQGAVSVSVMKKALDVQAAAATQLIASLPQPALATSGTVGTKVNTFA